MGSNPLNWEEPLGIDLSVTIICTDRNKEVSLTNVAAGARVVLEE